MNDDRMKYGTEFTSVKVHQSPGGNSSLSLAWEEPGRRRAAPQQPPREQPTAYDRAARNPPRGEPRAAPAYVPPPDQRSRPQQGYRAYQDPEPAFRDDLPWRERQEPQDPRFAGGRPDQREQRGYEQRAYEQGAYEQRDQRAFGQRDQRGYEQRDQRGYEQRDQRGYEQRGYEERRLEDRGLAEPRGYGDARPRGEDERPRARAERADIRQLQSYGKPQSEQQDYAPRYEPRGQEANVHTSVKVKEPPGGRSNFTFG